MALLRRSRDAGDDVFPGFADVVETGTASWATMYRARELGTDRPVALKLLTIPDVSPRALEAFHRESIALGALSSHPNIVTLYRTFETSDGRPVLVLELCSGSIGDRLNKENPAPEPDAGDGASTAAEARLSVREVVSIGIRVAAALETAHRAGILHRDVRPHNILLTEFGEPALADFGVATLQQSTPASGALYDFTTVHAPPELLEGAETSAATDVYELASTLYQLISGQPPFRGFEDEGPAAVILRILRDPVRPLDVAGVPPALSELLIRAMAKEPADRPATAAGFATDLGRIEVEQGWPRTQFITRDPERGGLSMIPFVDAAADAAADAPARDEGPSVPTAPATQASAEGPAKAPAAKAPARGRTPNRSGRTDPAPRPGAKAATKAATKAARTPPSPSAGLTANGTKARARAATRPRPGATEARPSAGAGSPAPYPAPEPTLPQPLGPRSIAATAPLPAQPSPPMPGPLDAGPPAATEPVDPASDAAAPVVDMPVSALRMPVPPAPTADADLDPSLLPRKMRFVAGGASLVVDDVDLSLRAGLRRDHIAWTDVLGFEPHFETRSAGSPQRGWLVAITVQGPVELPATRASISELRQTHATLDAYQQRAQALRHP